MPHKAVELLDEARLANLDDPFRHCGLVRLGAEGRAVITGDLHGHRRNFQKIVTFADLRANPDRHVVLQEIIHGGPKDSCGGCLSFELLLEAARYKLEFPDRVHMVMGNHDTACIAMSSVMKDGREMNRSMLDALQRRFGDDSDHIFEAIQRFLLSQPLAVRTESRVWISHSLPADRSADMFDPSVFSRPVSPEDCLRNGQVYLLTWGRRHSRELLERMAALLDVDVFVLGHQPQEKGWNLASDNTLIISSEHDHGCLVEVDLSENHTAADLAASVVPLASVA